MEDVLLGGFLPINSIGYLPETLSKRVIEPHQIVSNIK